MARVGLRVLAPLDDPYIWYRKALRRRMYGVPTAVSAPEGRSVEGLSATPFIGVERYRCALNGQTQSGRRRHARTGLCPTALTAWHPALRRSGPQNTSALLGPPVPLAWAWALMERETKS